jgi:hypothetical protein
MSLAVYGVEKYDNQFSFGDEPAEDVDVRRWLNSKTEP